jgi:hypothetical protein
MTLATLPTRAELAERLLRTASRHSLDPDVEVEWDAGPVPGLLWMPEHRISLYGTHLWDGLSHDQRVELSKHEVASQCSTGIWFETIFMHLLLRHHYGQDQVDAHARHTLTEIAEECRHSLMFGRFLTTTGCPDYGPGRRLHHVGRAFKALANPTVMFAGALFVEETLDAMQREGMRDAAVQPLIRQVSRLHVVEEARHITFARAEVARHVATLTPPQLALARLVTAGVAYTVLRALVHPRVYASVGLDPREAYAVREANPHWRAAKHAWTSKVVGLLQENGLLDDAPSRLLLRRAGAAAG